MQKLQTLIYQSQQEDVTSEHNDQPIRGSVCVCLLLRFQEEEERF